MKEKETRDANVNVFSEAFLRKRNPYSETFY
jgi:hypothetical protein